MSLFHHSTTQTGKGNSLEYVQCLLSPEASRKSSTRVDHERDLCSSESDDSPFFFVLFAFGLRGLRQPPQATEGGSLDAALEGLDAGGLGLNRKEKKLFENFLSLSSLTLSP